MPGRSPVLQEGTRTNILTVAVLTDQYLLIYTIIMPQVVGKDIGRLVAIFHALSDKTRLRIIACLKDGEQCVCDLTEMFKTGQSRLSFHLRVLKEAGLVRDRPEGRWIYYTLNEETLEELHELMDWIGKTRPRSTKRECCP
ncbi:MAG: metalloregulator ArsR/SmtB family transcription factor [Nitrospira sp.]